MKASTDFKESARLRGAWIQFKRQATVFEIRPNSESKCWPYSRFWEIVFASVWAPSDGSLISSAAAVAKAIDVLSEYYSSAAFVQVHTAGDPPDCTNKIRIRCSADGQTNRYVEESESRENRVKERNLTEPRGAWKT